MKFLAKICPDDVQFHEGVCKALNIDSLTTNEEEMDKVDEEGEKILTLLDGWLDDNGELTVEIDIEANSIIFVSPSSIIEPSTPVPARTTPPLNSTPKGIPVLTPTVVPMLRNRA
jgi:hypothetical protein